MIIDDIKEDSIDLEKADKILKKYRIYLIEFQDIFEKIIILINL